MLKRTFSLLAIALLAGCSSTPSEEETIIAMAKSRAMTINSKAPYKKIDQYQIMKAKAREDVVEITILYGGGGNTPPTKAASNAVANYCNNAELNPLLNGGVNYNIIIMDMRGRPMVTQPITAEVCQEMPN